MILLTPPLSSLPLLSGFLLGTYAQNRSEVVVYGDVNVILSELHELWPKRTSVPPSNISGLTFDDCNGTNDCVPPRVCFSCPSPPCYCVKSPIFANYGCKSSVDCDEGEYCEWDPAVGHTTGICLSARYYASLELPVMHEPIEPPAGLLGMGLTGDRCFSHSDCRSTRSCLGESVFTSEVYNLTTCEYTQYPCVCTPIHFTSCSTTSDCIDQDEVCASVLFNLAFVFSHRPGEDDVEDDQDDDQEAVLDSICISSSLTDREAVFPVSRHSNSSAVSHLPTAKLEPRRFEPGKQAKPPERIIPEMPPFSVPELSTFNAFTTDDLRNEFIGGILSVIIVSQLHKIFQSLLYSVPAISHESYSNYIVFSRLCSFRHISRLFTGREPYLRYTDVTNTRGSKRKNLKRVLLPLLALLLLFVAEFSTIIAGTDNRREYFGDHNFDPIIAPVNGTPRPRFPDPFNSHCDDFFVPTRGIFESGKVLKCAEPYQFVPELAATNLILVEVFYGSGKTIFGVYSPNGTYSAVQLSVSVRSESGVNLRTMPFRPDLMNQYEQITFLNSIVNGIRKRLGYEEEDVLRNLWSTNEAIGTSGLLESLSFGYRPDWNESSKTITTAVMSGLRDLDLVLNSTGAPWVYTRPYTFEQQTPLMAIVKPFRIPHGWLALAALLVTVVHIIVNSCVTHFDDVAYIAMKELMGEDCVLGPLADGSVERRDVELR